MNQTNSATQLTTITSPIFAELMEFIMKSKGGYVQVTAKNYSTLKDATLDREFVWRLVMPRTDLVSVQKQPTDSGQLSTGSSGAILGQVSL